jgi:uncharacterized cupin superfamily protein
VTVHLLDAVRTHVGDFRPKPTALDSAPQEALRTVWASPDGLTQTGVWECTPGSFTATRDGYHEICQILTGRATIVAGSGEVVEVSGGDTLVTPAGWRGTWTVHETLRKQYVIVQVASPVA